MQLLKTIVVQMCDVNFVKLKNNNINQHTITWQFLSISSTERRQITTEGITGWCICYWDSFTFKSLSNHSW
jgi:hypothetical protein